MFTRLENNIVGKLEDRLENIIVIAIEPLDRFAEYTPWFQESMVSWVEYFEGSGDFYLSFLIEDLFPYLEERYDIKFKNKYLAGASLGGLISSYGIFKYPDYFKGGIFVSASFWYEGFINYLKTLEYVGPRFKIYMDVGSEEKPGRISLFKDVVEETKLVYEIFLELGLNPNDIRFLIKKDMPHKESFFIDRIYDGIEWIVSKE